MKEDFEELEELIGKEVKISARSSTLITFSKIVYSFESPFYY